MKQRILALGLTFILFSLSGCTGLYDLNVFGAFDNPAPLQEADVEGKSLSDLQLLLSSRKIRESLPDDTLAALNTRLLELIASDITRNDVFRYENGTLVNIEPATGFKSTKDIIALNPALPADRAQLQTFLQEVYGTEALAVSQALEGFWSIYQGIDTLNTEGNVSLVNMDSVQGVIYATISHVFLSSANDANQAIEVFTAFITGSNPDLQIGLNADQMSPLTIDANFTALSNDPPLAPYTYFQAIIDQFPMP